MVRNSPVFNKLKKTRMIKTLFIWIDIISYICLIILEGLFPSYPLNIPLGTQLGLLQNENPLSGVACGLMFLILHDNFYKELACLTYTTYILK